MTMTRTLLLIFYLLSWTGNAVGQSPQELHEIAGIVLETSGEPVPYATLYIAGTQFSTSANSEGKFVLPLDKESLRTATDLTLVIRAVGYQQTSLPLSQNMADNQSLEIRLEKEDYRIEEVRIVQGEDPAYAIIRKAIKNRKKHLEETPPYTAKVYIKGVHRLLQAPEKLMGIRISEIGSELGLDSNRTGILYLSESESRITSHPPRLFREEMISSSVSGDNNTFSINRATDLQVNFYENYQQIVEELSPRPFVSPIADNALNYYRYQYQGFQEENGLVINKIKVIPRRKAEPVYEGDIYIVEDSWRIYGLHLLLTREAGINLVDSLRIRQDFLPVEEDIWMPSNIRIDVTGGLLGFRIGGQFAAVFSEYNLQSNPEPRSAFRELLRIEKGVNEKDSAYWAQNRPLALTGEEELDYIRKDSLRRRRESPAYLDSLDRRSNKFGPISFLIGGYTYYNRKERKLLSLSSPLSSFTFNTVEGLAVDYVATYRKRLDSLTSSSWIVSGKIRYGFANKRFNGHLLSSFPVGHQSTLTVGSGSSVEDLNSRGSIHPTLNMIYTLFVGENPMKLYERGFAYLNWSHPLPANIRLSLTSLYEDRRWLENSSHFAFISKRHREFTPNNPFESATTPFPTPLFERNQAFRISLGLSYDFSIYYQTLPTGRRYLPSKYPRLTLTYTKGFEGILGSDSGYDLIRANLQKSDVRLGLYGQLSYSFSAGTFLKRNEKEYLDRWHFRGTETLVSTQGLTSYLLLDYYRHSTSSHFAEAHLEYNFSTILTSKIPLIRRLKLQELVGVHLLKTGEITSYGELHLGVQRQGFRLLYARSFGQAGVGQQHAIRIGVPIP